MRIDGKMLVEALKTAARENGMTYKQLGRQLGFSDSKTKNVFGGRTALSGDDVLRIFSDHEFALPILKKYLSHWQLRREITEDDRRSGVIAAANEDAMAFPMRIQKSIMPTNVRQPLSELARDIMSGKGWWALRTGCICSATVDGETITFTPIAPDFTTAMAMEKMGWIWREGKSVFADWGKIHGGKIDPEAAKYCEEQLRAYILNPDNGFELDDRFLQLVGNSTIGEVEMNDIMQLRRYIGEVENIVEHWSRYELPDTPDEYGTSVKDLYRDKFDYLKANVLDMCAVHDDLNGNGIEIDRETEQRYKRIMSEDGNRYRYSALIDPILAVSDRRGHLASPTAEDWKRYLSLKGGK